jgi:hypothetical protein
LDIAATQFPNPPVLQLVLNLIVKLYPRRVEAQELHGCPLAPLTSSVIPAALREKVSIGGQKMTFLL